MSGLIRFFAKEHLFGNLVTLLVFIMGLYALFTIRKDTFPQVDFDITVISTVMPGASPEQIETLIVNPIEETLREVDGIKKVFSTSTEGTSVITVQLDPDARDPDKTNRDLQMAIDRIDSLPEEALDPIVKVVDTSQTPVVEISVGGELSDLEIRSAAKFISDELSLLPSVARIGKSGYRKREYVVVADPKKLAARSVPLSRMIGALDSRNIALPGGSLKTEAGTEVLVRTDAEFKTMEDILNTVIVANDEGFGTRVRDVATVIESQEEPRLLYRANGKPSINLLVLKKEKSDAIKVVQDVRKKLEELKPRLNPAIQTNFAKDFTVYLENRISILSSNVYMGIALVLIILGLFLPFRVALIVSIGIPFSMFCVFLTLSQLGYAINLISLLGFIIVVGMLVDDAIVICENIWRRVEMDGPSEETIVKGVQEVIVPVFASVMTTILAFAPMMFMTGIFGKFVFEIPLVVVLALGFSLFEAYLIMPSHFASMVAPYVHKMKLTRPTDDTRFNRFVAQYSRWINWVTRKRYVGLAIIVLCMVATGILTAKSKIILFPSDGIEQFFLRAEADTGVSITQMANLMKPLENLVADLPKGELQDFTTEVGIHQNDGDDPLTKRGSNYAQIYVELTPLQKRSRKADAIIEELKAKAVDIPGIKRIVIEAVKGGPPQGRPVSIDIRGRDFNELNEVAARVAERLEKIDGVREIQSSFIKGKDQWTVTPRHSDTERLGLTAREIATTVRAAFDGVVATSVRDFDEEIDIRVTLKDDAIQSKKEIQNLEVGNSTGNLIPLKNVADLKLGPSTSAIIHNEYRRIVNVSADLDSSKLSALQVQALMSEQFQQLLQGYPNVSLKFGGESEDTEESMASLGRAFLVAILMILFILILSFKSLLQPMLILFSIPIGFMGVQLALTLHGRPFSFMSLLGVIALAGVIVNNSIVFLEFVNAARKEGKKRHESYVAAAATRVRPIILTTATTLAGLLPTAYGEEISTLFGIGGADPFVIPLALALGWGLGFGSILNALFFPALVAVFDDLIIFSAKIRGKPSPIALD